MKRQTLFALALSVSLGLTPLAAHAANNTEGMTPTLSSAHVRYMGGFEDGTMRPDQSVTRAEAASMLHRLLDNPEVGTFQSFLDVATDAWYYAPVASLADMGLIDKSENYRPNEAITRAELVDMLVRLYPNATGEASFSDVTPNHPAYAQIAAATSMGWLAGYPDGTFRPDASLTRAEACAIFGRVTGHEGDAVASEKYIGLGLYSDVSTNHWARAPIAEASVAHMPDLSQGSEVWTGVDESALTFTPGIHNIGGTLYSVDRYHKLQANQTVGAYSADATGALTQTAASYQLPYVPYISQIDGIQAWVGCEPVSSLMGLKALGYASDVSVTTYLANLPFSSSNPEYGFVGSPYVVDRSKRTTIYPAALAGYINTYTDGATVGADFRGASVDELRQELLAGHVVVAYETLWWAEPYYNTYLIDGQYQSLVTNNHAVLVYGYDPEKGYLISDPYNYYNRGQTYQYWKDAATFDHIWNLRKVGTVMR